MSIVRRVEGPGKHGHLRGGYVPPEYRVWSSMVQRCHNPGSREYKYYGARGIGVCARWREKNGFVRFLCDVGLRPAGRPSLNRVDNDGDYEPGNVQWADAKAQARNRRSNKLLTYRGKRMILSDFARARGLKPGTLVARLLRGMTVAKALTTPVEPRKPYAEWVAKNGCRAKPGPKPGARKAQTNVVPAANRAGTPPAKPSTP